MARKQRNPMSSEAFVGTGSCAVCGMSDTRGLVNVELAGGAAILCGTHALMHSRTACETKTVAELRAKFGNRRSMDRRAHGDVDELAASLTAAFTQERRFSERRS
ncbi:MAG: hypothetical protein FWD69_13225 [Polyangiaceae bacterium]|nr:hypothetical protein [Polyangiaceae bacterium]